MGEESYQSSDDEEKGNPHSNKHDLYNKVKDAIEEAWETTEEIWEDTEVIINNVGQTGKSIEKNRTDLCDLKSSLETIKSDKKSLNHQIKIMAANNHSTDISQLDQIKNNIKKFEKMIHEETDKRISSQKILEKRSSILEAELLAEKPNNILITKTQHDLEVAVINNKIIQVNNHTGAKNSVVNSIKEGKPSGNIHQLQKTTVSDTSEFLQTELQNSSSIKVENTNLIEDTNQEVKFNISRYLMENIIHDSAQITREIFKGRNGRRRHS